jgi:hypothetical protein
MVKRSDSNKENSMTDKDWVYITVHPDTKVKVDTADLERINRHRWRITLGTQGRRRVVTTIRTAAGNRSLGLGKFLMNPPKGKQVYTRRFNDELDYRKSNLIVCTLAERQRLLPKKRVQSTSEFRGVSKSKAGKKWRAAIEVDGRSINLGDYDTQAEAALAYNKAAKKHFGEMAYQNQVDRDRTLRKRN